MDILDIKLWAGTDESLAQYLLNVRTFMASGMQEKKADYLGDNESPRLPRLLSKQGSVGVITIAGTLNNTDSWINPYIGAVGYPEIRQALVFAAKDADIKVIALDVKSGGGAVSGMIDTAELIRRVDADVKPVYGFTDSMAASAGYALYSSTRKQSLSSTAEVGSIGVLMVHQEMTKMMADIGITPTVIRSGRYKALGNPYEKLSELAVEVMQKSVDETAEVFEQLVADNLGQPTSIVRDKMGQGRVFMGKQAVDIGLASEVTNFDAFMSALVGGIDAGNGGSKYGANLKKGTHVKTALTDADVAALAAGAAQTETQEKTEPVAAVVVDPAPVAETNPVDQPAVPDAASQAQVDLLKGQLAEAQATVLSQAVEVASLKAAAVKAEKDLEGLTTVAKSAVGNLRVALGGSKDGLDPMSAEALVAEHAQLAVQFNTKFKAGGVAVSSQSTAAEQKGAAQEMSPRRRARLQATRPSSK
jgi:capsid assembly protease